MKKPLKAAVFLLFSALFSAQVVAEEQVAPVTLTSVMEEIELKILDFVFDITEPEMPEIYIWEYKSLEKEILCLAQNIYFEAGHEPHMGKVAVGLVTINRVKSYMYPNSICAVVWQVGKSSRTGKQVAQFSWTRDGKSDTPRNKQAWAEAQELARDMLGDADLSKYEDFTRGATHYHATYVKPHWRLKYERVAKIGLHIFYRDVNQVYEGSVAKL